MGMVRRSTSTTPRRTPQLFSGGLHPRNLQGQVYQVQLMMMRSCSKQNLQECSEIAYNPSVLIKKCLLGGVGCIAGGSDGGYTVAALEPEYLPTFFPYQGPAQAPVIICPIYCVFRTGLYREIFRIRGWWSFTCVAEAELVILALLQLSYARTMNSPKKPLVVVFLEEVNDLGVLVMRPERGADWNQNLFSLLRWEGVDGEYQCRDHVVCRNHETFVEDFHGTGNTMSEVYERILIVRFSRAGTCSFVCRAGGRACNPGSIRHCLAQIFR